jgi:hypothetical protein
MLPPGPKRNLSWGTQHEGQRSLRNAAIDDGAVSLWVIHVDFDPIRPCRLYPNNDQAGHKSRRARRGLMHRSIKASIRSRRLWRGMRP